MLTNESVEKVQLIFLTSFSGVSLPYSSKRSSIVDQIAKPLLLASYGEICPEAFSTDSNAARRVDRTGTGNDFELGPEPGHAFEIYIFRSTPWVE